MSDSPKDPPQKELLSQAPVPLEIEKDIDKALEGTVIPGKKKEAKAKITSIIRTQIESPIPLPAQMAAYEQILPGCTQRFMDNLMAESQHRRDMEKRTLDANFDLGKQAMSTQLKSVYTEANSRRLGMICSFGIGLSIIGLAAYVALIGHPGYAATICGTGIAAVIAVFRMSHSEESQPQQQQQTPKKK